MVGTKSDVSTCKDQTDVEANRRVPGCYFPILYWGICVRLSWLVHFIELPYGDNSVFGCGCNLDMVLVYR